MKINGRAIGSKEPCYIIAEMSANHGGSLEHALAIVRAVKEAGADAIKLQTYTPDTLTIDCHNEYFELGNHPLWGNKTLYELYKESYTPWEWHRPLKAEADKIGLTLFSTPFDETAVDFLEQLGVPAYKIASFELVDDELLKRVAKTGKPVILSTGMASFNEIEHALNQLKLSGAGDIAILKCVSAYPAAVEDMNLLTMADMREKFGLTVGLSDHSLDSTVAITAVALGASVMEKHFVLTHQDKALDGAFSLDKDEFRAMVHDVRTAEKALGHVCYGRSQQEEASVRFRRSIFVVKDVKQGEAFTRENVRVIRPGFGLSPAFIGEVLKKRAAVDIARGTPLLERHIG